MKARLLARIVASREGSERGSVLVLTVFALVPICLFAALAIDLGNVAQSHTNAKDATDSAALRGAGLLGSTAYAQGTLTQATVVTDVENEIIQDAGTSGLAAGSSAWSTCTAPLPSGWPAPPNDGSGNAQNCIAFNTSSTLANLIQVAIPPHFLNSYLGQVGGVTGQNVSAVSTAEVTNEVAANCGLCVIGTSGTTLAVKGNSVITVTTPAGSGGSSNIVVNSNGTPAATISGGGASVTAVNGQINVVGTTSATGCVTCFSPSPTKLSQPIPDPLAAVPPPSWTSMSVGSNNGSATCNSCGTMTINPGIYSSIKSSGNGTANMILNPGVYVITGSLTTTGSGGLVANGVLLFFTCGSGTVPQACPSTGQSGGSLSLNGGGELSVQPLTATNCSLASPNACSYADDFGMAVFYDRHDTGGLTLNGGPTSTWVGTVYGQSASMTLNGNGQTVNSLIDVDSVTLNGNATLSVSYNPAQNVSAKPQDQAELCSIAAGSC